MVQFYISWLGIVLITFLTTSIETMVNFWSFSWNQWRYTITEWRMKYSLSSNWPTNIIHIRCIIGCSLYTILRVTFCSVAAPFYDLRWNFPPTLIQRDVILKGNLCRSWCGCCVFCSILVWQLVKRSLRAKQPTVTFTSWMISFVSNKLTQRDNWPASCEKGPDGMTGDFE